MPYLSDLLAELNAASVKTTPEDMKIDKLNVIIHSKILLKQFKLGFEALEHFAFPFIGRFQLPPHLKVDNSSIIDAAKHVQNRLFNINQIFEKYKTTIHKGDEIFKPSHFNDRLKSTNSLFVWKNEDYNDHIVRLLSGHEVYLNADIMKLSGRPKTWNAVKFDEIKLYFTVENSTEQQKLDELLQSFDIELTHQGDNHYRFKNKIYTTQTIKLLLSYSLDDSHNVRVRSNKAYLKLLNGDIMLSPYANWKIKLTEQKPTVATFKDLKQFENKTDLHFLHRERTYSQT